MTKNPGGMEFRPGRPLRLPPPPDRLPATPVRLWCHGPPEIGVGQTVEQGQPLTATGRSSGICPISGTVSDVCLVASHPTDGASGFYVTIKPAGHDMPTTLAVEPPQSRTVDDWLSVLGRMCPWGSCDGHVGLTAQLEASRDRRPDTLICVGLDEYPPYPVCSSLMMSFSDDVVLGTLIISDVVGAKNAMLLSSKHPRVLASLKPSCRNFQMRLVTRDDVYPSADPTLVVWSHPQGRHRLPVGANPVQHVGMALIHPWTAVCVARWFTRRQFDLVRPIMIGWTRPAVSMTHCYALVGQPLSCLGPRIAEAIDRGDRMIMGHPMANKLACVADDRGLPVVLENQLLVTVLGAITEPQPKPCISCGWCVEICPTGLRPNRLWELCDHRRGESYLTKQLAWCIDCGLCSHVCPSSLPLVQTFRQTKAIESQRQKPTTSA